MPLFARLSARFAVVLATVVVAVVAAAAGRDGLVTLGIAATTFLLFVAALGALVFVLLRGEFPPRIGRDAVEFSPDRVERAAASLETLELAIEETIARIDEVSDAVAELNRRVEELELGKA
ncbi:MAG TPA: hypothetical protein VGJ77_07005 [Gaiellaceae bacterium]|jgi:hypothetical protein